MVELFKIGHFEIYLFGVMIALGVLAGIFIANLEAKRKKMDENKFFDFVLYTLIVALVGARIYYILAFNLSYYIKNPAEILSVRSGGLSIQGGLLFGVLFAIWYTKRKNISFWDAADAMAPAIVIGQAIGRIGCDVFGVPMKNAYFWGIKVGSQLLHPAQMYEMVLDLILFSYLWRKRGKLKYRGELFINYIIGFSINRAIVEFFRSNPVVIGPFTVVHATSLVFIIAALIVARLIKNRNRIDQIDNDFKVPLYQYLLVVALGAAGMWFYYFIH